MAFGAQQVAYYIKYQNAPLRFAATWSDPSALRLGALPKQKGGAGGTVCAAAAAGESIRRAVSVMRIVETLFAVREAIETHALD